MCGICGLVAIGSESVRIEALGRMNATMVHRGPDDEGYYYGGTEVALAMRRLSIIDRQGGHQPIHNEDRTVWVVCNGEIYNHQELRRRLERLGHRFYTSSDTEVIVHLYEEHGNTFVEHLRGMFVFALHDQSQRLLVLGRDRAGQKPLYYSITQDYLVFASEIKAIHASSIVAKRLDGYGLDSYISHGFVAGRRTMFEGVEKLPAGCLLVVKDNKIEVERYWDLPWPAGPVIHEKEVVARVRELIEEAVRIRLMSEVPLGAFLSGGIDSSAVVGIMSRQLSSPVKTFSVGFGDSNVDEIRYARKVARYFDTDHHELIITGCSPGLLEEINWYHDEPAADPAIVPTFLLSQYARKIVTVALTGEGGDEIFGGYNHYKVYYKLLAFEHRFFNLRSLARALECFRRVSGPLGNRRLWKGIWIAGLRPEERPRGWLSIFTDCDKKRLFREEFRDQLETQPIESVFSTYHETSQADDYLTQAMYVDSKSQLADQLLMKVDKMSMASSLEARCPLLDHKLIEFVRKLPTEMKISNMGSKLILRKALIDLLPTEIMERPKQGFEVPLRKWLREDVEDCVHELLLRPNRIHDYLDHGFIRSLWTDFCRHHDELAARQLWLLLNFAIWYHQHWN